MDALDEPGNEENTISHTIHYLASFVYTDGGKDKNSYAHTVQMKRKNKTKQTH